MPAAKVYTIFALIICTHTVLAQKQSAQTLSAKENIPSHTIPEYKWWDLLHYTIHITPDYNNKFISGSNEITFRALETGKEMKIDLQQPMQITAVTWKGSSMPFKKMENAYIISFPQNINKGSEETIVIQFDGHPTVSVKAPWDSGWIWAADKKGRPWMSIACEGSGAGVWLPCKNVLYDEPDNGVLFNITVPDTLTAIANGRLEKKKDNKNGTVTYSWKIVNPINNYNIIPYIGKYVTWHENYPGLKGNLDCDYWVLDYNLDKAKKHFTQTDTMLRCFEYWLGPYPFYEDSYKLVEAPLVGMEHQSAVAYGNNFENGYINGNLSHTAWGLKWDFILVHESGHEWFGNSITASNDGESWIHEGFTKYLETLYTDYVFGREAGDDYAIGIWKRIKNDEPILGTATSDAYNKGAALLHMIRQIVGDTVFRGLMQGLNKTFYHQTVNTEMILKYINRYSKHDFDKICTQYLTTTQVPVFEYSFQKNMMRYRWAHCIDGFNMPLKISFDAKDYAFIYPTTKWQELTVKDAVPEKIAVDRNFYIESSQIKNVK